MDIIRGGRHAPAVAMTALFPRIARRAVRAWRHLRYRAFLRGRVTGRIKLRGDISGLRVDPSFRCDGDLWLGVYGEGGQIVIAPGVSASGPLTITAIGVIRIGSGTLFGPNVFVSDHYHGDPRASGTGVAPSDRPLHTPGPVEIGEDVLFGINSVILAPARIGRGVIVAANAVVKGEVAAGTVYTGLKPSCVSRADVLRSPAVGPSIVSNSPDH